MIVRRVTLSSYKLRCLNTIYVSKAPQTILKALYHSAPFNRLYSDETGKGFTERIFSRHGCKGVPGSSNQYQSNTWQSTCISRCYSTDGGDEVRESLKSLEAVAAYIRDEAVNVLVMTGAGISTASGIPDFRSPKTGLYHNLKKYNLPYPEAIFDINFFLMDQRPFVALAQELYPGVNYRPNAAHYFLRLLQDRGKLLRLYTQNIDGLERLSGIEDAKLLEAHGSFATASCTLCGASHDTAAVKAAILTRSGAVPECGEAGCKGKVKPDIVFFGENLPQAFWKFEEDLHVMDLLLIMGTSLEVYPFANIAESARRNSHRVLLNQQVVGSLGSRPLDCLLTGDLVDTVHKLAAACGWTKHLQELLDKDKAETA